MFSRPGRNLPPELSKEMKSDIDAELELDEDIFIGLSFIPSEVDTINLLHALNEKELLISDFEDYCNNNNLYASVSNNESAALFQEFAYGRSVAWLHIPQNREGLVVVNKLSQWSLKNEFNIQCSSNLYCLLIANNIEPLNCKIV